MSIITGSRGEKSEAVLEEIPMDFSTRFFSGGKMGLIVLGAGLGSVVVPIIHFVSVPVGVLLGLFLLYQGVAKSRKFLLKEVKCPCCGKFIESKEMIANGPQLTLNCEHCGELLKVSV